MKLLRLPEVMQRTCRSRSRIYHDYPRGEFPKPIKLGGRAVAWLENEIEDWLNQKIAERDR